MRSLSAPVAAAIAASSKALVTLVQMSLTSTLYLNTSAWSLSWNGQTWLPTAGVGALGPIEDAPGEIKGFSFSLSGVPAANLAIALNEPLQGKAVTIYTAIVDTATSTVLDALAEWTGRLDTMSIEEQGAAATITVTAEHAGIDLLRPRGLKYSQQDQDRLFAGDTFFEYVVDTADREIVWPAASFFR